MWRSRFQWVGNVLKYTATVGTLPVKGADGKATGEVVFTSYIVDGAGGNGCDRPVTFAFNGGPGAASVYLNLGAIGPKRVDFGAEGQSPSDPATLKDNPGTWLDFTDLVFIDPIGTGFSRSLVPMDETKKDFYGPDQDIAYLSKIVYDWLVKNGRLAIEEVHCGRELWRVSGAAADGLSAVADWGGDQWVGDGVAGAEPERGIG